MADEHNWAQPIIEAVASHAATTGRFERVNQHDLTTSNSPGNGITCAVWKRRTRPTRQSGLRSTSAVLRLTARLMTSALQEPRDAIDPALTAAECALLDALHGDLKLTNAVLPRGTVRGIDVFGSQGHGDLSSEDGYLGHQRVYDINIPVIVDGLWAQNTGS